MKKIELLAPAGNLEKMKTAFLYGADAVYLGIPDFSLRVRINDFDLKGIKEAVSYAHKLNKKVYATVNIFAHNKHLVKLPSYIKKLKEYKVDALIASDPGIIQIIKKVWPQAVIHLSTQANCTNWKAAEFWHKQGVKRVILGRETTLLEIKEIHKKVPKLELECFVHGAMCMAYSGRCFLSKYFLDRSANLGDCGQPCRWKYNMVAPRQGGAVGTRFIASENTANVANAENAGTRFIASETTRSIAPVQTGDDSKFVAEEKRPEMPLEIVEEEHGSYILNSKDLCLIEYLDDLAKAGVGSFKIEGRAKSVYYIATVVGAYRKTTDDRRQTTGHRMYEELYQKLVHRGYTTGFLLGEKADQNIEKSHETSEWEFCGQTVAPRQGGAPVGTRFIASENAANVANVANAGTRFIASENAGRLSASKNAANVANAGTRFIASENATNTANAARSIAPNVEAQNFTPVRKIIVKIHNTIKLGDVLEIVKPPYDIIKYKVEKMIDIKNGKEIKEAHGGGNGQTVELEIAENLPVGTVIRRKLK